MEARIEDYLAVLTAERGLAPNTLAAYRRDPADRVPIMSPIRWAPTGDIDAEEFGDWRDEAGFREIAHMVQQHCDVRPTYSSVGYPGVWAGVSYQRFL